ncbi:hypothetical protein ACJMK2_022804 [Sinanodonta woodiana]|uniref:Uncharacterized protein n=1 Tax=Sinanodonta woodiana TaxID=1069815 RepID=A0ABD3TM57_SINWO
MKLAIGLLLFSLVALTYAQFQCVTDVDCVDHCRLDYGRCKDGTCHCFLGRRQTCAEHGACTCADGTPGHCDHAGVCHCHH